MLPRCRGMGAALVATLALLVALLGSALVPLAVKAAGPYTFSDCGSVTVSDIRTALSSGLSISFTGTEPCTVALGGTTLRPKDGGTYTIDGGVGLTFDEQGSGADVIDLGVSSSSSLTLEHVALVNGGYGIYAYEVSGAITVTSSTISGNKYDGIYAYGASGPIAFSNSTVSGNSLHAIYVGHASGPVAVSNSTVNGNVLNAIYAGDASGPLTVTNSTLSGNSGFGIYANLDDGQITVTNSTISGNAGYGIYPNQASGLTMAASILADNKFGNCGGPITDGGYNLVTDTSCGLTKSTSLPIGLNTPPTDAQIGLANDGVLGSYGGPTQTIALEPSSIAVDAIPTGTAASVGGTTVVICPSSSDPPVTDQRGVLRPQDSKCDIGAYELIQQPLTETFSQCPTQAELQQDFDLASSMNGQPLTIDITPASCLVTLTSALTIGPSTDITLNGAGLTLDGQDKLDIIDINDSADQPSTLTVNQATIEHGYGAGIFEGTDDGGATVLVNGSTFIDAGEYPISATNVVVSNSTVTDGTYYGIVATNATVTTSTITNNGTVERYGGIAATNATVTGTILAGNGPNCAITGTLTDGGDNLSDDSSCAFKPGSGSQSSVGDSGAGGLNLLPLGNYGGLTPTIGLGQDSVAIDFVPNSVCATLTNASGNPLATDQRGIDRPQGLACDAGAYEAPAITITTTPAIPAPVGWYNASQLGVGGSLPVTASFSGLITGDLPTCNGATFTNLPTTPVIGLNQTAVGTASLGDGSYTVTCGVGDGDSSLGFSYQGPNNNALPLDLKVDTSSPGITLTTPTASSYDLHQSIDADYGCTDPAPGSGITAANCVGTVPSGQPIDTSTSGAHTFTVNATDNAGNTNTKSVIYTVGYIMTALPGNTATVNRGYYAVIRFAPEDVNGRNYASRNLTVSSVELDGPNGQTIPFAHPFQFGRFGHEKGYQLSINTRNLTPGSWTLVVQIGTGKTAVTQTIKFEVE